TVGPDGALWFTEGATDKVGRITTAGLLQEFGTGITAGSTPTGITLGPHNNLWFTENTGDRIGPGNRPAGPGPVAVRGDAGAGPAVKVFNGDGTLRFSFFAYGQGFTGGVRVAMGDVNGDGTLDVITGAGAGAAGGHVKVFDGKTGNEIRSFFAFPGFAGG